MTCSTPDWSALSDGVTVRHLDIASVTSCGELLVDRIRHHMATTERGDAGSTGPTWGMVNDLQLSSLLLVTWALFPTMAVVDRSAIPNPHQVTMIARGFGDPADGSGISARDQRRHTDPLTTTVSSILVAGTDRFEVWARLVDPRRFLEEGDAHLLAEIDRSPGTEVVIDQTVSVDNGDGRVWVLGHAIAETSDDRVALIVRRRGRPGWQGARHRPNSSMYRSWPGGGYWCILPDGEVIDLTRQIVTPRPD